MKILVLNCGSSSIKYKLFNMLSHDVLAEGAVEKIGLTGSFLKFKTPEGQKVLLEGEVLEHRAGIEYILGVMISEKYGCVKSLDEIDAVGAKREEENNKEHNATLNQLLVELSSTDNEDILVIGATNRSDILDPALKRQGRLSRHIYIPNPDFKTRLEILKIGRAHV